MASSDVNINKIRANTLASLEGFGLNKNAMEQQIADAIEQARMQAQSNKNMASVVAVSSKNASNYKAIEEEVKNYLQEANLEKIQTNGDGNCFFYAVQGYAHIKGIYYTSGSLDLTDSVIQLREVVADTIHDDTFNANGKIRKDPYYLNFFAKLRNSDPEPIDALRIHTNKIIKCEDRGNNTNTWADEVDVAAFSNSFHVCIVIHDWRKTNNYPYHIAQIVYPSDCDVGSHRIHILRTNENHYSLLMPINDPEYNAIKLFDENVSLPLDSNILSLHRQQLENMATQATENLSRFRLNQPVASAAVSRSVLNNAPEQVEQQRAILENARQRAARPASSSSSTLMPGNSKASAIVLNGENRSALEQNARNAVNALSQVSLTKPKKSKEEIQGEIIALQGMIRELQKQIEQLEKSDPEGKLPRKRAQLEDKKSRLSKKQKDLQKGGTRKRRTHKKQNKNNRKSHRKGRK
jgi:DNA repair exonuclease SbcCD ATPase subunit